MTTAPLTAADWFLIYDVGHGDIWYHPAPDGQGGRIVERIYGGEISHTRWARISHLVTLDETTDRRPAPFRLTEAGWEAHR